MFKALKLQEWTIIVFFQTSFFSNKCAPFFLKIGKDFSIDDKRAKGLELMKIIFITHLSTFGSKMLLTLKILDFENVALTKVVHIFCDRGHECIIYMI
jgi:hypothetical protein